MKYAFKLILLIILAFISISAQRKYVDIILFADSINIKSYPYHERYDSLMLDLKENVEMSQKKNPDAIFDYLPPQPEIYAMTNSYVCSLNEYRETLKSIIPTDLWLMIKLKVEWNGNISEAKIFATDCEEYNVQMIINIVKKLRAKPAINYAGFPDHGPYDLIWLIKGRNRE